MKGARSTHRSRPSCAHHLAGERAIIDERTADAVVPTHLTLPCAYAIRGHINSCCTTVQLYVREKNARIITLKLAFFFHLTVFLVHVKVIRYP